MDDKLKEHCFVMGAVTGRGSAAVAGFAAENNFDPSPDEPGRYILDQDWYCLEHAGRIVAGVIELANRRDLSACAITLTGRQAGYRAWLTKDEGGPLRMTVNDIERGVTVFGLPLVSSEYDEEERSR